MRIVKVAAAVIQSRVSHRNDLTTAIQSFGPQRVWALVVEEQFISGFLAILDGCDNTTLNGHRCEDVRRLKRLRGEIHPAHRRQKNDHRLKVRYQLIQSWSSAIERNHNPKASRKEVEI